LTVCIPGSLENLPYCGLPSDGLESPSYSGLRSTVHRPFSTSGGPMSFLRTVRLSETSLVTIFSTLLLTLDAYHRFTPRKEVDRLFLYLVFPLFFILLRRQRLSDYGFRLGNWKRGLAITFLAILVATPVLYLAALYSREIQGYYRPDLQGLPWNTFLELIGWEFFFRGWLLFTYLRAYGADGLWLHAVPFALAHIGKPELETITTLFGGYAFGWIAWRTDSFLYPFLIHWYIASMIILFSAWH
jgi:membrane protease YdiL (CAAX protease family)